MKKIFASVICCLFVVFFTLAHVAHSDEFDNINKQIGDLQRSLDMSVNATRPLESQLENMQQQINGIKSQLADIDVSLVQKRKHIEDEYKSIAEKTKLFDEKVREYYIQSSYNSPFAILLTSTNASQLTKALAYQKKAADQDKEIIVNLAISITSLEEQKRTLESEESRLSVLKTDLDEQSAKLNTIVQGAKAYQASLTTQIAQLSARQQELLQQKYNSLGIPRSAYSMQGGCSSDITNGKDPGFSPRFALFTYGVPNRVGLNQYGAKGRAEAGQSATQILQAYYSADLTSGYNTGINIHVTGTNEYGQSFDTNWDIETYVKHVYEMPTNWPSEALKAQAIAARSYALASTNNGASSICPSQQCQVVKQELNDGAWQAAVDATRGQVLTSGGQPIKAWFSSTHGGYVFTSADIGWSSTAYTKRAVDASGSIGSFSDLASNAYDKSSPWFYCDWGARSQYAGTAWINPQELADIVNVVFLAQTDSGTTSHLSQIDKPNPDGTDTWDAGRVKQELQQRGKTPFNSISSMSVSWDKGTGRTTGVTANGDAGSQTFDGSFFKQFFNLRAPANIQIVGPLYNIEQR